MKRIRAVAVLPTLVTMGNLVCGFFAIVVAARIAKPELIEQVPAPAIESAGQILNSLDPTHNLMLCGALILLAMVFDALDGQVARLTRTTSDFGGQLDSLCDLVSFGVAPSILLVKMCPDFTSVHREAIWSIAAMFACCAAMRLARFNVETDEADDHTVFSGLPTPAAAAVIASFAILSYTLRSEINYETYSGFDRWLQQLLPPFTALIALLMVSRIPYPHLLSQFVRGERSFPHLIGLVSALLGLTIVRGYAVPVICILFVCGPPVKFFWNRIRHRDVNHDPIF